MREQIERMSSGNKERPRAASVAQESSIRSNQYREQTLTPFAPVVYALKELTGSVRGPLAEFEGRGGALNLSVSQAIAVAKNFLAEEKFEDVRVVSAIAIEGEAEWKITAEIGQPVRDKKEIVVNDRDGQIISYKSA